MTVILISEENHGQIAVTKDYKTAIKWLIKEDWLNKYTTIWEPQNAVELPIEDVAGQNWKETILNDWDIKKFNEVFNEQFFLDEVSVFE